MKRDSAGEAFFARNRTLGIALILLFVLLLYAQSIDLPLFADDYISWTTVRNSLSAPWWKLLSTYYNPEFYRPLELLLIRLNMNSIGASPLIYRWMTIVGHLATVLAVYWMTRRLRQPRSVALTAAMYFGFSHANAMAVLSNDAASQIYTTLFGVLALATAFGRNPDRQPRVGTTILSVVYLFAALLWKDAGVSYLPGLVLVLWWRRRRANLPPFDLRLGLTILLYLAALGVYLSLRSRAGAASLAFCGEGRYDLCPGMNVPVNIGLFLLSLLTPVGSSIIVLRLHSAPFLVVWIAGTAAMVALVVGGLWLARRELPRGPESIHVLLGLFALSMLPDVLIRRVSELYSYKPNAIFAVLFSMATVALWRRLWVRRRPLVAFLIVFVVALTWSNIRSITHKSSRLRTEGREAARIMEEIHDQMPTLPSLKIIVSNREPGPAPLYSIYFMDGIRVLGGSKVFEFYYGVKPEEYVYCPYEELGQTIREIHGDKVVLLFQRDHVYAAIARGARNPFPSSGP